MLTLGLGQLNLSQMTKVKEREKNEQMNKQNENINIY